MNQIEMRNPMKYSVLSDFGLLCRNYRIRNNKVIGEQANEMNVRLSEIVKFEESLTKIPQNYVSSFKEWAGLDLIEATQLIKTSQKPKKVETVPGLNLTESRKRYDALRDLPPWSLAGSKKKNSIIFGSMTATKSVNAYKLPSDTLTMPRSFTKIGKTIRTLFGRIGVNPDKKFDLLKMIECQFSKVYPHFALLPVSDAHIELPRGNMAITRFEGGFRILVRESIYMKAFLGDAEALYVIAHEFSHMLFHRALPKSLMDGDQQRKLLRNYRDMSVEKQADDGAISILAPYEICKHARDAGDIANMCNIPLSLARYAAREYGITIRRLLPYEKYHL
ncbi:MAG: hypothetical protein JKY99_00175 [Rhizobiales bacterium]|nr:hypothetical protein [Hyphomicrobiales bacterium]